MLEAENAIQNALNEAGALATTNFIHRFCTDGSPIVIGQTKLTSKELYKEYQTLAARLTVSKAYVPKYSRRENLCPLERAHCHQCHTTLRHATVAQVCRGSAGRVVEDFQLNHNRTQTTVQLPPMPWRQ